MSTATASESLTHLAGYCLRALEDCRHPDIWASTRYALVAEVRTLLARQLAEEDTGVSFAQARVTSLYPRAELSPRIVDDSDRYGESLAAWLHGLPDDLDALTAFVRDLAA